VFSRKELRLEFRKRYLFQFEANQIAKEVSHTRSHFFLDFDEWNNHPIIVVKTKQAH
jgi:hypothetical protein